MTDMNNRRIGLTDEEVWRYHRNNLLRAMAMGFALTVIGACIVSVIAYGFMILLNS